MIGKTISIINNKQHNGKRVCDECRKDGKRAVVRYDANHGDYVLGRKRHVCHGIQGYAGTYAQSQRQAVKGFVVIALNGSDYYEVYLNNEKETRLISDEVCFDELGELIDRHIERGDNKKEYDEFCSSQLMKLVTG